MRTKRFSTGLLAGLLFGVIAAYMFSGGSAMSRAASEAQNLVPGSALQRYVIATWAYPSGLMNPNGGTASQHGAYVLDTRSGKVWQIKDDGKPQLLGSIE
jgi:hypothetical protein